MKISDVLNHKGAEVATVRPTTTVRAAVDELAKHNIGALVVIDGDGSIAGIVSERDIVRALPRRGAETLDDRLIGIVSIGDVVKNRIDELQATTAQLEHYITG
jgi:CBS domain-containing protein